MAEIRHNPVLFHGRIYNFDHAYDQNGYEMVDYVAETASSLRIVAGKGKPVSLAESHICYVRVSDTPEVVTPEPSTVWAVMVALGALVLLRLILLKRR